MPSTRSPATTFVAEIAGALNVNVCLFKAGLEMQPVSPKTEASSNVEKILDANRGLICEVFIMSLENKCSFFPRRLDLFYWRRRTAEQETRRIILQFGQNIIQVVHGALSVC